MAHQLTFLQTTYLSRFDVMALLWHFKWPAGVVRISFVVAMAISGQ